MDTSMSNLPAPYKGLQPYAEADAPYFFGREQDRAIIENNLIARRLTVLYGASVGGKSSVLLAGVVPHLQAMQDYAVVVFRDWQGEFRQALRDRIRETVSQELGRPINPNDGLPLDEFIYQCAKELREGLLCIFDQFEEYFLYHPTGQGFDSEFLRMVSRKDVKTNFLISMREDNLSKLDRFQGVNPLQNMLRLDYLGRSEAEQAIRKPLEEYNKQLPAEQPPMQIEDTLVEDLLDQLQKEVVGIVHQPAETRVSGASEPKIDTPVLQLVMVRLWMEATRSRSHVLKSGTLEALGYAKQIVKTHVDGILNGLEETQRDIAAQIFRYLITPSGTKLALPAADLADLSQLDPKKVERVLRQLSAPEIRFIRTVSLPGQPDRYEILHDTLATAISDWRIRYEAIQAQVRIARRLVQIVSVLAILLLFVCSIAVYAVSANNRASANENRADQEKKNAQQQAHAARLAEAKEMRAQNQALLQKARADNERHFALKLADQRAKALQQAESESHRANQERIRAMQAAKSLRLSNQQLDLAVQINQKEQIADDRYQQATDPATKDPTAAYRQALSAYKTIYGMYARLQDARERQRGQIYIFAHIIDIYSSQHQNKQALQALRQAARLHIDKVPPADAANWLHLLALRLDSLDKPKEAVPLLLRAIALQRRSHDPDWADTTDSLALIEAEQGNLTGAEKLFQQAITLCKPTNPQLGDYQRHLAALYIKQNKNPQAEELLKQAVDIQEKVNAHGAPDSLYALAELYMKENKDDLAAPLLVRSIPLYRDNGDPNQAKSTALLGLIYIEKKKYGQAEQLLEEAIQLYHEHHSPLEADLLLALAKLYRSQEEFAAAEPLLRRAIGLYNQVGDPNEVKAITALAFVYVDQDDPDKFKEAEDLFQRAVTLYRKTGSASEAPTLNALALIYIKQKRYAEAEKVLDQAQNIYQNIKVKVPVHFRALLAHTQGLLYFEQGKYEKAAPRFQQSVDLDSSLGGQNASLAATDRVTQDIAENRHYLAVIGYKLGMQDQAKRQFNQALTVQQQLQDPSSYREMGQMYYEQQQYPQAEQLFQLAIEGFERTNGTGSAQMGASLEDLAKTYLAEGKPDQAVSLYEKSLPIFEKQSGADSSDVADTLQKYARALRKAGRATDADNAEAQAKAILAKVTEKNKR